MDLDDLLAMSIEERLRKNAELIVRQTGDDAWRSELAAEMGCSVSDVGVGPVSRVRDSEALAESNFRVLLRDLRAVDGRVTEVRFGHWGFGWMEGIAVPLDNPRVVERVEQWVAQLREYPVADELDLADVEADYAASDAPLPTVESDLLRRLDGFSAGDPPGLGQ